MRRTRPPAGAVRVDPVRRIRGVGVPDSPMLIGDLAERIGLSFRTIRYYEEIGLVVPSSHTKGGFRLYAEADVERLVLVKAVRPLRLNLDETREMLDARDRMLAGGQEGGEDESRIVSYLAHAERRLVKARVDLVAAEEAIRLLHRDLIRMGVMAEE
jgi:DNA-binding transcriptional MerR regulator